MKRIATFSLAAALAFAALETGAWLGIPGIRSIVPEAHAIVGRPLTPVSYAGVARRTAARCAPGPYYC